MTTNHSVFEVGSLQALEQYVFSHPKLPFSWAGKLFLKEHLALTSMEISFNKLPAQQAVPFLHRHQQNEEVYLVISGTGEFQVDGEIFSIQEGTVIRVAPDGERSLRNTGDRELIYLVVQAPVNGLQANDIEDGKAVTRKPAWSSQSHQSVAQAQ